MNGYSSFLARIDRHRVKRGDRAVCLVRDCDVVITSWTDARISWPRCLPVGRKGHPSLLVDDELARAIRTESGAAIHFWWGVSVGVVWRWRKALGVGLMDSDGTRRLIRLNALKGGAVLREAAEAERKRLGTPAPGTVDRRR